MNKVTNKRGFTVVETFVALVILLFIIVISFSMVDKVTTSKIANEIDNTSITQKKALFSQIDDLIYDMKSLSDISMNYVSIPANEVEELKDKNLDNLTLTATQVNEEGHIIKAILELRETEKGVKLSYSKTKEDYSGANLEVEKLQDYSNTYQFLTSMRISPIDTLCTDDSLDGGIINPNKCTKVNKLFSITVYSDHKLKLGDKSSSYRREFYYGRNL